MNEYNFNVKFEKGRISSNLKKLVQNDYNSTKINFTFDKKGRILFKMLYPDGTPYIVQIDNDELVFGPGVLSQDGTYEVEIALYTADGRLTDYATTKFDVRAELIQTDEIVELDDRLPILDSLIGDVNKIKEDAANGVFDGDSGVYVGTEEPTDADINIWINPDGEGTDEIATKEYVDEAIKKVNINGGGGTGGTTDYIDLSNKPKINNVELNGNKTLSELGIQPKGNYLTSVPSVYKTKSENDALYQPIGDYAKSSDIPTKTSQLTNDSGFITDYTEKDPTVPSHVKSISTTDIINWNNKSDFDGNYNNLTNKPTIPTKTSQLTNDSLFASENYVKNEIANAQLGGGNVEIDLSGYATKDDLLNKVDKELGKSLISNNEIERLANVTNYDDTAIKNQINSKASISDMTDYIEEHKDELKGDKGDTGERGIQGIQGVQGIQGEKGDDGYTPIKGTDYFTAEDKQEIVNETANKIFVPTKTSELTNDSGFLTSYTETDPLFKASASYKITNGDITNWNSKSNFSGNYDDLTNKPTIPTVPTKVSAFTNDSGYLTSIPREYVTATSLEEILFKNINTNNIFKINDFDNTYFYDASGKKSTYQGYGSTGFMEVGEYEKDKTQFHFPYQSTGVLTFWDSNKNFLGSVASGVETGFTIPYANCFYLNMAIPTSHSTTFYMYKKYAYEVEGEYLNVGNIKIPNSQRNNLYNKKLIVLGDSITQGYLANVPYVNYISANNLTLIKNYGISQSTISNGTNASDPMCVRYSDMTNDADYVFVMGGTNDFIHSVEIGTNDSTDVSTFKGALNVLIEGLINKYPNSKIAFSTPIPLKYSNNNLESNFKLYVNAMIEICQKWSIPCLNLFACSRINPNNATILNNYFKNDTSQGIHPDENGQRVISEVIESFLNNLYVTDYLTVTEEVVPETDNNLLKLLEENSNWNGGSGTGATVKFNNDNTLTINADGSSSWGININQPHLTLKAGKTYKFSCSNISSSTWISLNNEDSMQLRSSKSSVEFTPSEDIVNPQIVTWISSGVVYDNVIWDMKLEEI